MAKIYLQFEDKVKEVWTLLYLVGPEAYLGKKASLFYVRYWDKTYFGLAVNVIQCAKK